MHALKGPTSLRVLGYAADWCPFCQHVQFVRVRRIMDASLAVPIVGGGVLGGVLQHVARAAEARAIVASELHGPLDVRCENCGERWQGEPSHFVEVLVRPHGDPLEVAAAVLQDPEAIARAMARLDQVSTPDAPTALRIEHVVNALRTTSYIVEERVGTGNIPLGVAALIILFFLLTPAAAVAAHAGSPPHITIPLVGGAGLVLAILVWRAIESGRGWTRKHASRPLARAIRPVLPSDEEIRTARKQTRALTITRHLGDRDIARAIDRDRRELGLA